MANGIGNSISEALGNRNVLQLMAQTGTALDPEGMGGILGRPTSQMLNTQAQQDFLKNLIDALGDKGKIKIGADGSTEMTAGERRQYQEGGLTPQAATKIGEGEKASTSKTQMGTGNLGDLEGLEDLSLVSLDDILNF